MLYFLIFSHSLLSSSSSRPKPVGIVHQYISHISEARIRKLPWSKLFICSSTIASKICRIFWIFLIPQSWFATSAFIHGLWVFADFSSACVFNLWYSYDCACFTKFAWNYVVYNISKIEDHPPILVLSTSIFLKHVHELMLMPLLHACLLCLNAWVPLYFPEFVN